MPRQLHAILIRFLLMGGVLTVLSHADAASSPAVPAEERDGIATSGGGLQGRPLADVFEHISVCSESSDWMVAISQDNALHEWAQLVITNNGTGTVVASLTVNDVTHGPFTVSAGNVFTYTFPSPIPLIQTKRSTGTPMWTPDPSKYSYRIRCSGR